MKHDMTLSERWAMRREGKRDIQRAMGETPGSLAERAVKRLSVRRHIVLALRSPLLPVVVGVAVLAGLALLLVGVSLGATLARPSVPA